MFMGEACTLSPHLSTHFFRFFWQDVDVKITVTRTDGSTVDVTDSVTTAYHLLWEYTRWGRDWEVEDAAKLAALAIAIQHPDAGGALETVEQMRRSQDEARELEVDWHRKRGAGRELWR